MTDNKMIPKWGGRRAQQWSAAVLARKGRRCLLQMEGCTQLATTADHIVPRSIDVSLQYNLDNGRPACATCNRRRSNKPDAPVIVDPYGLLRPVIRLDGCPPNLPPRPPENSG